MSDSPAQKETIQNLQTECHYLSLALNRTNQKTDPDEYSFLRQKLVNAEEQLAAIAAASAADEEEQTAAIPDDYSFDNEGPAHSDVAAYYAATNSYRQKLRDGARSYKLFAKRSSSSSSSDDRDSDDSSIGSANRHVVRHYRKSLLVEKSRDFLTSNKAKMNTHFKTTPISWVRVILLTTAFIFILIVIIVSNRRASGEFASATLSTEPCATLSISLKTDRFGNETSWDITRHDLATQHSESIIKSGGPYRYGKHTTIHGYTDHMHESICLPVGDYKFILYDEMGDGICCNYGHGQYGLSIIGSRNENSIREVRPMKDGLFLGEEEITSFQITLNDVSGGLEVSNSASSSSSSPLSSIGEEDGNNNIGLTTTNATNIEEQTTSNEPPGVSSESWSEKTDDFYLLNDPSNWTMGDDNLLSDDDLIMALETHSDDAVNPLLYQNIEEMDSNSDGKVSSEEYVQGTQEITNYCTVINVQTSFGRRECEKMCGDDHFCCFQPLTQGSYDCREDPSFDCETYKPCEILFDTHPSNELDVAMGDSLVSPSGLTDEEKAIIEEKVYQYCSYGVAGLGIGKCQEICNDHLCCFEEMNFGVGSAYCKSSYQGLCVTYAGCEVLVASPANLPPMNSALTANPTPSGLYESSSSAASPQMTLEEKLQIEDKVDQACSEYSINAGNGQCESICESNMCCFDTTQHDCKDYNQMCPFYSSCEKLLFANGPYQTSTQPMNTDFDPMAEEGWMGN